MGYPELILTCFPVGYTGVYNVLDYSCISFPSGVKVDAATDKVTDHTYTAVSDLDATIQSECKQTAQSHRNLRTGTNFNKITRKRYITCQ